MAIRIDRSRYTVTPRCSGRQLLSLGRLLRKYTPPDPSEDLAAHAEALDTAIEDGSQAYADRIRQSGPSVAAEDREDDDYVDALLSIVRNRVEHWQVFERPTVQRLIALLAADGIDFEHLRERAAEARRVHRLLFANGFDATRAPYAEQAEYMIALARIIEQEQLAETLDELVGGPFCAAFDEANPRYQAMVERRAVVERGGGVSLRDVNANLQAAIQDYQIALLATLRTNDEEGNTRVLRALAPVDALRQQLAARARGSSGAADPADPSTLDELAAEQEAVDAEIGFVEGQDNPEDGGGAEVAKDALADAPAN